MQIEITNQKQMVEAEGEKPLLFTLATEAMEAFERLRSAGAKKIQRKVLIGTQWHLVDFTVS